MAPSSVSIAASIEVADQYPVFQSTLQLWNLGQFSITMDTDALLIILITYVLCLACNNERRARYLERFALLRANFYSLQRSLAGLIWGRRYEIDKLLSPVEFSRVEQLVPRRRYSYAPLREEYSEVRLLYLMHGSSDDAIRINIRRISLNDRPKYLALSYVWGNDPADVAISLNGHEHKIQRNLAAAISLLRHSLIGNDRGIPLWIDALCINQGDVAERNKQIKLMRSIYTNAFKVKVWLGIPDELMELAAAKLEMFQAPLLIESFSGPQPSMARLLTAMFGKPGKLSSQSIHEFDAICRLLDNGWFSRAWVIQEVTFPEHTKVEFIIGRHGQTLCLLSKVSQMILILFLTRPWFDHWEGLSEALDRLRRPSNSIRRLTAIRVFIKRRSVLKFAWDRSWELLCVGSTGMSERRVLESLFLTRDCLVSDPRDKVYVPLGLALTDNNTVLMPDYGCPLRTVYIDLVMAMINYQSNLDILSFCNYVDQTNWNLPSWVPDWRQPTRLIPLAMKTGKDNKQLYHATRNKSPIYRTSNDFQTLTLKGSLISNVSNVVACGPSMTSVEASVLREFLDKQDSDALDDFPATIEEQDKGKARRAAIVRRTVVADQAGYHDDPNRFTETLSELAMGDFSRSDSGASALYSECIERLAWDGMRQHSRRSAVLSEKELLSVLHCEQEQPLMDSRGPEGGNNEFSTGGSPRQSQEWESFTEIMEGRSLFVTQDGHFGIAPVTVQPGDTVVVLYGGCTPFVLRRVETKPRLEEELKTSIHKKKRCCWIFLGEAYVHNLMDGEALDMNEETDFSLI